MNNKISEFPWRETEKKIIQDVVDSRRLCLFSGQYSFKAENELNSIFSGKKSLILNSGTAALQLSLKISGIGPGDEVIVPAITYVATALAIKHVGATPIFADIDPSNFTLDLESCSRLISRKTKAIIFVHLFGVLGNILEISNLCRGNSLILIEDCAQAFGSVIDNKMAGTFGDFSCFSFFESKTISAGEGGALLVSDENLLKIGRKYRHHGMDVLNDDRNVDVDGYNFKPSEFVSGMIYAQLKHYQDIIATRNKIVSLIKTHLNNAVTFQKVNDHEHPVIDKLCFILKNISDRDLIEKKINPKSLFVYLKKPLYKEPIFQKTCTTNLPVAETFCRQHLVMQISPYLQVDGILRSTNNS